MNYTLHQLQVFLEVVRQESITRAAEEMHMSQPALSIQLKNFQSQFSHPLTEVIGRKLYITEFGRSIAELAENVVREADAIRFKTLEYEGLVTGKLRITSASTGKYVIPYFLSGFLDENRGVDLALDVTNKVSVVESIKANEVDFAFVSTLPADLDVHEEVLLENRLYLVGSKETFDPDRPLIFREEGSATRAVMDSYFGREKQRKRITLTSGEAVKQAVVAGLGYSIIPLIGIKNELYNGDLFIIRSRSLPQVTKWRLIWLKRKKLSPVANAFLTYIREHKGSIIGSKFGWYLDYETK